MVEDNKKVWCAEFDYQYFIKMVFIVHLKFYYSSVF